MDGMAAGPFPVARGYSSGVRGRPISKIGLDGFVQTPKHLADRGGHRRPVSHIVFAKGGTDRAWSGTPQTPLG